MAWQPLKPARRWGWWLAFLLLLALAATAVRETCQLLALAALVWARQERQRHTAKEAAARSLAQQVEQRTTELRQLASHLENAREDERGHLARELHDDLGSLLTAMKLELARLGRMPGVSSPVLAGLARLDGRLNHGIALKRRIVENLRPSCLDQLGLMAALELLCADVSNTLGIPVHARLHAVALNKEAELTVYRVVQESLTNISKYAQASTVHVTLEPQGQQVRLSVTDNGLGFALDRVCSGRHGLLGMRVRLEAHAGRLAVRSNPGQGTWVWAELPCASAAPSSKNGGHG